MSKALLASQTRCVRPPAIYLSTLYSYAQCTNCKGLKDKCSRCQRLFCRYWESSWLQRIWLWKGESSCEPSSFGERLSTNCSSPRGNTCLQSHPLTWGIKSTFLEFEICVCQYSGMEKLQTQTKWKPVVAFAQYARMLTRCLWSRSGWHFPNYPGRSLSVGYLRILMYFCTIAQSYLCLVWLCKGRKLLRTEFGQNIFWSEPITIANCCKIT